MSDINSKFINQGLDSPIEKSQITLPSSVDELLAMRKVGDEAALAILKQDMETADADKFIKDLTHQWTISDQLLNQPWLANYYYNPGKTNIPRYTLSNIIDVVTVKAHNALFFDTPWFMLRPKPSVDQKVMWAKEVVLSTQQDEENTIDEFDRGWFQCAHLGTQIYKYGWIDDQRKKPVFKAKGDPLEHDNPDGKGGKIYVDTEESDTFEMTEEPVDIHRPWLKWRDLRYLKIAPTWNVGDIRKAPWLVDTDYPTFEELDDLRDVPGYTIPSREELETLFFPPDVQEPQAGDISETRPIAYRAWLPHSEGRHVNDSADPYAKKIRLLERWDKYRVTVALENQHGYLLIRNETHGNVDDSGNPSVPYLSSNWRDLPSNGYGQGLGQLVGPDQQIEKGVLCAYLDILSFKAKPSYVRQKPLNQQGQNEIIDLGKIISVEGNVKEYMALLEQPTIDGNLITAIESAKASAATTSGANELFGLGGTVGAGRGTGTRSGTGAQNVAEAQAGRMDGPLGKFVRQVLMPWLYISDRMNAARLPARTLREILADTAPDYGGINHMTYRNAKVDFEVLAGHQLSNRSKMAAFLPQLAAVLSSPAIMQAADAADMIFEVENYMKFCANLAGYKYGDPFFRKRTEQEKKEKMQAAAVGQQLKNKGAMDQIAAKNQGKLQQIDSQQLGKAANDTLRLGLEREFSDAGESGETF